MSFSSRFSALLSSVLLFAAGATSAQESWPSWRGPDGTGAVAQALPTAWSAEQGVTWSAELPGRGISTPILWNERLYVTTAVALEATPEPGERGEFHGGGGPQPPHSFQVRCLGAADGKTLWTTELCRATPHEGYHRTYGSHASAAPTTDGERLYVTLGSRGVYALDLETGKPLWTRDLEVELTMRRQFGEGTAPVVAGKHLVLNNDQEGPSFLCVLDAETGEERWRVARDEPSTWATPLVTEVDGVRQVIVSGTNRVRAYDLLDGRLIWECGGLGLNAIPNPLRVDDFVVCMSGYRDPQILAIRLGGEGDLTDTDAVLWKSAKGSSYTPSPVRVARDLYCLTDRGFLSAFALQSGTPHYLEERLPRGLIYKASPLASIAGERLYLLAETGEMVQVALGTDFEVVEEVPSLARSEEEMFIASPIAHDGALFLRSTERLLRIDG